MGLEESFPKGVRLTALVFPFFGGGGYFQTFDFWTLRGCTLSLEMAFCLACFFVFPFLNLLADDTSNLSVSELMFLALLLV